MNTTLGRLNAAFAYTLSVLAFTTFLVFASTFYNDNLTSVEIAAAKVTVANVPDFSTGTRAKKDLGIIRDMAVKVNLTDVFNWNVKEVFLYLTAEYATASYPVNQVVLWDKIVLRENNQVIDLKISPEYYFFDEGKGLVGNDNVTLTLSWNVIPNAGALPRVLGTGSTTINFPNVYTEPSRYQ